MGVDSAVTEEVSPRAERIVSAYEEVAEVLEAVDLAEEPELADEIIGALAALDRAYSIADEGVEATD